MKNDDKYLFNGYYRSGTTIVWDILKNSNPKWTVFYEPLNPRKGSRKNYKKYKHKLHQQVLWEEYIKQGEDFVEKLVKYYPFENGIPYCRNTKLFKKYIDQFFKNDNKLILQSNRAFFHLDILKSDYGFKSFHIIRNPINVYKSFKKIYKKRNFLKKIKKYLYYLKTGIHPLSKMWRFEELIEASFRKHSLPLYWNNDNYKKKLYKDPFKIILLGWIVSNYSSFKLERNDEIKILPYEVIVSNPIRIKTFVQQNSNLYFNTNMIKKRNSDIKMYKKRKVMKAAKKLKMKTEYEFILSKLEKSLNKIF